MAKFMLWQRPVTTGWPYLKKSSTKRVLRVALGVMAEDEGFEPSIGFPIHAFQACALGRYANPPEGVSVSALITRTNPD
jgi:hypothetical protein